ncbi:MAG: Lrp/AsnC family transcriptional regulator [Synergistaceae bacterium]|jgi:Lrp/AsnC family leucine-responsive transcriptional regulator|nr:Lrp/AsnC family transcriptional regulator [Synergistaceae bacterium]
MKKDNVGGLPDLQKRILEELKEDCRTSSKELAKKLNFSVAAITANLHELEKSGVIQKFTVRLDLEKIGFMLRAIVSVSILPSESSVEIDEVLSSIPQVVRYYKVTGEFDYYVELAATSLADLESSLMNLCRIGKTQTSIVLESRERGYPRISREELVL